MQRSSKHLISFILIVVLAGALSIPCPLRAEANETTDDPIMKAWGYHALGRTEEALLAAEKLYKPNGDNPSLLTILLSQISFEKQDFEKTLKYIEEARPKLTPEARKAKPDADEAVEKSLYSNLLQLAITANEELGRCDAARVNAEELAVALEEKNSKAFGSSIMGYCQLKLELYADAAKNFKAAYDGFSPGKRKDEAAYGAAATHAKSKNLGAAIKWLKIPLTSNKRLWMEYISKDEAFEEILKTEAFEKLLAEVGG